MKIIKEKFIKPIHHATKVGTNFKNIKKSFKFFRKARFKKFETFLQKNVYDL